MSRKPTELRRAEIADAALKVIAEQGLGRFTTQAIAAEVGVTDGSLFRHFSSKEEIVLAALDRVEERLFEGFPYEGGAPLMRLRAFFFHRAALVRAQPVIARLAFSEELPHAAGPRGAAQVEEWKRRSLGFIADRLREAQAGGSIPAGLPVAEAALMVLGTLMALARLGSAASPDKAWRLLEGVLESGVDENT